MASVTGVVVCSGNAPSVASVAECGSIHLLLLWEILPFAEQPVDTYCTLLPVTMVRYTILPLLLTVRVKSMPILMIDSIQRPYDRVNM